MVLVPVAQAVGQKHLDRSSYEFLARVPEQHRCHCVHLHDAAGVIRCDDDLGSVLNQRTNRFLTVLQRLLRASKVSRMLFKRSHALEEIPFVLVELMLECIRAAGVLHASPGACRKSYLRYFTIFHRSAG